MDGAVPVGELYVEQTVADLPEEIEDASFAVTGEGIFQFDAGETGWQPIQYGSQAVPIPGLRTQAASVGQEDSGRPLISNGDRTVYVDPNGGDDAGSGTEDDPFATIQAAVQQAPIYLRDQYVIDLTTVPDGQVTYDEDVLVPTIIGTGQAGQEVDAPNAGPFINLVLRGNRDNPGAVRIGSVMFGNLLGTSAGNLYGATILRESPYDNEGYGVSAYGDGEVKLIDVNFTDGPTHGVLVYGARMKARQLDLGQGNLEVGLKAKRHASVLAVNPSGEVSGDGFRATSNSRISIIKGRDVSGDPLFNTLRGGLIYDDVTDSWVGLSGNTNSSELDRNWSQTDADASPGDVWYEDGSGSVPEGFYGQTKAGVKRID